MNEHLWNFETGTKVSVPLVTPFPFPRHVAMLTDWMTEQGELLVLTTTPDRGVHLTTATEFANGRQIRVDGYPGNLPPHVVMWRGHEVIGEPYAKMNCDELVEFAHGRPVRSEQVELTFFAIGAGLLLFAGAKALAQT